MIYLIVGLGNPDKQYAETRHNVGWQFLDWLAKKVEAGKFKLEKKLEAEIANGKLNSQKVILAKPQIFVNNSGLAVKKIKNFYKLKNEQLIVAHDDLDVPFGATKLTPGSGAGGHKGVQSIINQLKTENFPRLKIGLANKQLRSARAQRLDKKRKSLIGHLVLSTFTPTEKKELPSIFKEASQKIEQIVS